MFDKCRNKSKMSSCKTTRTDGMHISIDCLLCCFFWRLEKWSHINIEAFKLFFLFKTISNSFIAIYCIHNAIILHYKSYQAISYLKKYFVSFITSSSYFNKISYAEFTLEESALLTYFMISIIPLSDNFHYYDKTTLPKKEV